MENNYITLYTVESKPKYLFFFRYKFWVRPIELPRECAFRTKEDADLWAKKNLKKNEPYRVIKVKVRKIGNRKILQP